MKYLGLAYFTPEKFATMAPDDVKKLVSQCPALDDKMRATGKVLISASLGDLDTWRTLRPRNGKTHVIDGPYTESKEVVGGLFVIEADTHDEALRIASMHPAATLGEEGGWVVELIPWISTWPDEGLGACLKHALALLSPQTHSRLRASSWLCYFWAERRRL
jgi:hypothetical protein